MQAISIVGVGCDTFVQDIAALKSIHHFVEQQFGENQVVKMEKPTIGDHPIITAKNWYVNPSTHLYRTPVKIPKSIDPDGVVARYIESGAYTFTSSIDVVYGEYVMTGDTK